MIFRVNPAYTCFPIERCTIWTTCWINKANLYSIKNKFPFVWSLLAIQYGNNADTSRSLDSIRVNMSALVSTTFGPTFSTFGPTFSTSGSFFSTFGPIFSTFGSFFSTRVEFWVWVGVSRKHVQLPEDSEKSREIPFHTGSLCQMCRYLLITVQLRNSGM